RNRNRIFPHQLIGSVNIKSANALEVRVRNQRVGVVANHLGGITIPRWKNGQEAACFTLENQRSHHCACPVRINNCEQRLLSTEYIPDGIVSVIGSSALLRMPAGK